MNAVALESERITLDDKYLRTSGRIYLSGVQALVRLPLMQRQRDRKTGIESAGFISGYRGSPLGTYDRELWAAKTHLKAQDITFQPGLNEDLAATSVWGTQQVGLFPGARHDGVFALWYAKAPGVDRSGDALKHANAAGTAQHGGVLAIAGDDHACKSASLPSQSDYALLDASIPVLQPANVAEVIRFGLIGWAMSRRTGLWVGMKALADTMDSAASIDVESTEPQIVFPEGLPSAGEVSIRWPDAPLEQERRLFDIRLPAAIHFGRANGLNRILINAPAGGCRLMIVAVGKSAPDVRQALAMLGLRDNGALRARGIGLAVVGMPWPLDPQFAAAVAGRSQELLVVEEKRPLVEDQLARALFNLPAFMRPRLIGKIDEMGRALLTAKGAFSARQLAHVIAHRLLAFGPDEAISTQLAKIINPEPTNENRGNLKRIPTFCPGCPHNRSTVVPDGSRALAGIGCHFMAQWMDRETAAFSQMGGEGAAWIGQALFTDTRHVFVNLGDGTYAHSGLLAIRAAVAAGVTITYKILYNDAVAMTGGQPVEGAFTVPQIVAQLSAEGVAVIRVIAEEPQRYAGESLPLGVTVRPRQELEAVQRELRSLPGVTVLIYDQVCAAEKRRRRKRGRLADAGRRIVINEDVCEGCGDCGKVSNCIAVFPLETPFGRKRQIDQTSCNQDASCLEGFCPSFVTIEGGAPVSAQEPPPVSPPPKQILSAPTALVIAGIGGTGIVTIGAVLGMAGHLDGCGVSVLDQVGLAQKGGEVTSQVRLMPLNDEVQTPVRIAQAEADTLISCDLVVASDLRTLDLLVPEGAVAIVNTHIVPTGDFPRQPDLAYPQERMSRAIAARSSASFADLSAIATRLLGDAVGANMMALGMAWQLGRIPISARAILRAIELNNVSVEINKAAFAWGRAFAHDPSAVDRTGERVPAPVDDTLEAAVERRVQHLVVYQDERLAMRFRNLVSRTAAAEQLVSSHSTTLAKAVARSYHKLLAIKDEYKVARLLSQPQFIDKLRRVAAGRFAFHLAPPLLARRDPLSGHPRKMQFGGWVLPIFRTLALMKGLRGRAFDPFGWTAERRIERRLISDYETLVARILASLHPDNFAIAVELASLPLDIRGFGHVKAACIERAVARQKELLGRWPDFPLPDRKVA